MFVVTLQYGSTSTAFNMWLLLAVTSGFRSATAANGSIANNDCAALLSWQPYAALAAAGVMCSPLQACTTYPGVRCNNIGRVTQLTLDGKNLTGTLPPAWSIMTELESLYLNRNNLSGTLPPAWSNMTNLKELSLGGNYLGGTLPPAWSNMTNLSWMSLGGNNLGGTLPPAWSNLTKLSFLSLRNNTLTGTLPPEWGAMTSLLNLHLSYNKLTGTLPPEWGAMPLWNLLLRNNRGLQIETWPKFPAIRYMDVGGTSSDPASLTSWMQSYFCTLPDAYSIVMPDGNIVACGYRDRIKTMIIVCSSAMSLLLVVIVLRCCNCQSVFCMFCNLKRSSSSSSNNSSSSNSRSWMQWMKLLWDRIQGVREWLLPQWKLLAVLLDVGSDVWVLVQVAPKGENSLVWPFAALLGGLFTPDLVASTVACWTWVSHNHPSSGVLCKLLRAMGWLVPFTAWLHVSIIKHFIEKLVGVCPLRTAAQPHERAAATLIQVVDPAKYMAFRSAVMAVTEDPVSMGVTSAFYVVNKQNLGQVLSTPTYCISMLLSCMHLLMEAWEHFPKLRQGLGGCLAGVSSLQPEAKGADGEGQVLPAGVPHSSELA